MVTLSQIKPTTKRKKKKIIGRGGKKGTYAGRGVKGQKSRAGRKIRPQIRDLIKKFPKLRGYDMKMPPKKIETIIFNLGWLNEKFNEGETISLNSLTEKGLVDKNKRFLVKILGDGSLTKKLIFDKNLLFSGSAREKIIKFGGEIK